jgi:4-hydroxy-tetrahydrodipicolinate reductase
MKIALFGYGKMGQLIADLAIQQGHEVVATISLEKPLAGWTADLASADVAIEFSVPGMALTHIRACIDHRLPIVVGTTGWYDRLGELKEECMAKDAAVLYASNFSVGVHLFWKLVTEAAVMMQKYPAYGVRIREIHHSVKLDSPSGTAITTAEKVMKHYPSLKNWTLGEGDAAHLGIEAERVGQVPGTHELIFESVHDSISIRHEAHSRRGFAEGALQAAEWLRGKHGFYSIDDWLNTRI